MPRRYIPVVTPSDKELPYYVLDVGQTWQQEHVVRPNGYLHQWIQCVEGEGELKLEGKTYRIREGTAMLLFKGAPHEYYAAGPTWVVDWIVFDGGQVETFLKQTAGIASSGVLYLSNPEAFRVRIQAVLDLDRADVAFKGLHGSSILYGLLTDIMQYASAQPNNSATSLNLRLKPLFHYIDLHYAEGLTLNELSALTEYTPQHLCTVFKKTMGIRLFQYINSVRIKKSKELLLQQPNLQVKEIAGMVGFDDVNYFCTVFKKLEQRSPNQYRGLHARG
ncbi:AraC family transcriptional regulator [Cohnella fermenti]|uniref:Helix-turn-helix domain-containing protein n=1 Tax=Cohnella fermenti TaxID=2565925 RepID=A0A4S4BXC2_9BACL|nr:AraC family transcriptional regulator [Cohnella fermenti]THF77767.1 helix-turn-helix domain-containing protein [Cohnella fermenti]